MSNEEDRTKYYREGFSAYRSGQKQCPYHKLNEKGISWMRGYYTAEYGSNIKGNNALVRL